MFREQVRSEFYYAVRCDAEQLRIERCVVKFAQRESVRNDRRAKRVAVRQNVRRIQELLSPEAADRAVLVVGRDHPMAECFLVEPLLDLSGHITAAGICIRVAEWRSIQARQLPVINARRKGKASRIVSNDEHRPRGVIHTRHNAMEVNQRRTAYHREPNASVVGMVWVSTPVPIAQQPI